MLKISEKRRHIDVEIYGQGMPRRLANNDTVLVNSSDHMTSEVNQMIS